MSSAVSPQTPATPTKTVSEHLSPLLERLTGNPVTSAHGLGIAIALVAGAMGWLSQTQTLTIVGALGGSGFLLSKAG